MKSVFLASAAAAVSCFLALPAFAQTSTTGNIGLSGIVTSSCTTTASSGGGSGASSTWGTINFNELDDPSTGQLRSGLNGASAPTGITGVDPVTATVICTGSGGVGVSVYADTPLQTSIPASGNFSNTIDYTATVTATLQSGTLSVPYNTLANGVGSGNAQSKTTTSLLSGGAGDISVEVNNLQTRGGPLLVGASGGAVYSSTIHVTISPQ